MIPRLPILFTRLPAMSLRGRRTLSRLFQTSVKIVPEKRHSTILEDIIPTGFEKDSVFEPDLTREQEKILDYHAKLVFKDGEFLVRTTFLFLLGWALTIFSGFGIVGSEEEVTMRWQTIPTVRFCFRAKRANRDPCPTIRQLPLVHITLPTFRLPR